jgi:Fibronectin type III domain
MNMQLKHFKLILLLTSSIILSSCSIFQISEKIELNSYIENFSEAYKNNILSFSMYPYSKIDSIQIDTLSKEIKINFDKKFSFLPFRSNLVDSIYNETNNYFQPFLNSYKVSINTLGYNIRELIPNYYRDDKSLVDNSRLPTTTERSNPVVFNKSKNIKPSKGLFNKNVALWHSHGWYYNHKLDRWLWQRARLFQTVEDIGPISFTIPYIVPMLENAGANVFLPRERDTQINEVIVDDTHEDCIMNPQNDPWLSDTTTGFRMDSLSIPANLNPFEQGGYKFTICDTSKISKFEYIPTIPEAGNYSVYISYQSSDQSSKSVLYTVFHSGGETKFVINQTIGGSTWIHLGKFNFSKGTFPIMGKVTVSTENSKDGELITSDAVRFGGGYGVIERNGDVSGRPKFVEASRYYQQYSGMPDTLIYNINNNINDYKDDYQSRGEWVNYLNGNPSGPNKDRTVKGLGIPIDASIAFHTDAGTSQSDTTIGTLSIYSIEAMDSTSYFPDNYSRLANRDFADIMQSEIVDDIKAKYDPVWRRRQLMEAQYSEATRPNVPSVLLELASHQNFLDAKFMADPRFRFDVSRSIYKSVLKFLSIQHGFEYVVQPLPVTHFAIEKIGTRSIRLSWENQNDPLEKTANPKKYMVYRSIEDSGFDNGIATKTNSLEIHNLNFEKIYNFKVTALNEGGESFPSEILSCSFVNNSNPTVLIVNCFDRIAPPADIVTPDFSGFLNDQDQGVPDIYDIGFTGEQHAFNTGSRWKSDDIPGHGSSYANYETKIVAGNTFNYPHIHGKAIRNNGYSFISVSDESVYDNHISMNNFEIVDLIMGEEKTTKWTKPFGDSLNGLQFEVFNDKLIANLSSFLDTGGSLFISGSYIGSDIFLNDKPDTNKVNFTKNKLRYVLSSDHAVKNGSIFSISESLLPKNYSFNFTTEMNDSIYNAEAPDAIKPINNSNTLLRYSENHYSAAVGYKGDYSVLSFGFPFETIKSDEERNTIMAAILKYLK